MSHVEAVEQEDKAMGEMARVSEPQSMLSTAELSRRLSRPPNFEAENRALVTLMQSMATSPEGILQKLADTALSLCRAQSAGLSLLEDSDQKKRLARRRTPPYRK